MEAVEGAINSTRSLIQHELGSFASLKWESKDVLSKSFQRTTRLLTSCLPSFWCT